MSTENWKKENNEKLKQYRRDWYHRNKEISIIKAAKRKKNTQETLS